MLERRATLALLAWRSVTFACKPDPDGTGDEVGESAAEPSSSGESSAGSETQTLEREATAGETCELGPTTTQVEGRS